MFEEPVLMEIAAKHQKTPAQILLRWNVQQGVIVIPKSVHKERMEENRKIWDFELDAEDMRRIAMVGFVLGDGLGVARRVRGGVVAGALYTTVDTRTTMSCCRRRALRRSRWSTTTRTVWTGTRGRASGSAFPCATRAQESRSGTSCAPRLRTVPTLAFRARWTKALLLHGPQRTCTCRSRSSRLTLPTA